MAARLAFAPPPARPETVRDPSLAVLAAGIAHELGQPLSAARVDVEGLHLLRQLGREPDPEHTARVLSRVGLCILSMAQIVEHLRSLADPEDQRSLRPLDLREVAEAVLSEQPRWNPIGITVDYRRGTVPVPAFGDALGLHLVLRNLLRNAVEAVATRDGGGVRIVVGPGPVIRVEDDGPGVPEERRSEIFHPFVSSKGRARGIGLALARIAAERMGARIDLVPNHPHGAVFTVALQEVRP